MAELFVFWRSEQWLLQNFNNCKVSSINIALIIIKRVFHLFSDDVDPRPWIVFVHFPDFFHKTNNRGRSLSSSQLNCTPMPWCVHPHAGKSTKVLLHYPVWTKPGHLQKQLFLAIADPQDALWNVKVLLFDIFMLTLQSSIL